jgi:hypothetical protein
VNKASQEWLLPFAYHSIVFATAQKLVGFHRTHDVPDEQLSQRLSLIHNLYIGAGPEHWPTRGDLLYSNDAWPMTVLCRIFWMCNNLQSLTLLHLDQNKWQRLEYAIPASLRRLVLGPIHGPFHVSHLTKRPQLEHFTSVDSFMRDDEVVDAVAFPSLKTFRRMSNSLTNGVASFCTDQVECISSSSRLERYEIVVCKAGSSSGPVIASIESIIQQITDDPRIGVSSIGSRWEDAIYDEYCDRRRQYFGA